MHRRTLLAAAALTIVWSVGAQAQAKAPAKAPVTPTVSRPATSPAIAQTRAPSPASSYLQTGAYALSMYFTDVNGGSTPQTAAVAIHLTHSGLTMTLGVANPDLSGTVSGTHMSLTGSRSEGSLGNVTLTLDGTATADGASGTVTLTATGQHATGTFSLTPIPGIVIGRESCSAAAANHCDLIVLTSLNLLEF